MGRNVRGASAGPATPSAPPPPGDTMLTATLTLTAAQLNALNTTPVQIVAAPGANKTLFPLAATAVLHFGTLPFLSGSDISVGLGAGGATAKQKVMSVGTVRDTADRIEEILITGFNPADLATAGYINQPLVLSATANFAAGDGTVTISLNYANNPTA